jgi:outer membrane protein assembly factor BamB
LAVLCAALVAALAGGGSPARSSTLPARVGAPGIDIENRAEEVSPARGDDWPTFARNELRQSYESLPTGITAQTVSKLVNIWTYKTPDGSGFGGSPIVVNGVVYVVDVDGVVTALDAKTGKPKWAAPYKLPESDLTKMTPALYDGKLFVASFQGGNAKYYFAALDPLTGHQLWITQLPGGVHGSPVVVHGIVYVPVAIGDRPACHPGGVYALDEQTGAPVGMPWLTEPGATTPDGGGIWSSLTYDGSQLFYGTGNTCRNADVMGNSVVAITPGSTSTNWSFNTAGSLTDDDVGGSVLRAGDSAFAIGKSGRFYHFNALTGGVAWSRLLNPLVGNGGFATPSYFVSGANAAIIVGAGYIHNPYTTSPSGGLLYGLMPNGAIRWEVTSNTPELGYVALTPDLAFTELDTNVDALDPLTGKVLWQFPAAGYFYASPVIVPSGLFVADLTGRVYAFALPSNAAAMKTALTRSQVLELQRRQPPQLPIKPKFCAPRRQGA